LNAKSKREAVVTALRELNRRYRMERLIRFSGTCDFDSNASIEEAEMTKSATQAHDRMTLIDTSAWIEQLRRDGRLTE
jgi:hypothetical protein